MAENENGQEKTEDPTAKRIEDSRDEGKVAQSKEITSVCVLLGASFALYAFLRSLMAGLMEFISLVFTGLSRDFSAGMVVDTLSAAGHLLLLPLAPVMGAVMLLGFLGQLGQVGWNVSAKAMEPNLEKLNPLGGFKRIISMRGIVELLKGLLKMAIVASLIYMTLAKELMELLLVARGSIHRTVDYLGHLTWIFTIRCLLIFAAMAALDYVYQRYETLKELKMTKQEVKDEAKNRDGDMQMKARMRGMVRQMLQKTGVNDVRKADVVITNPNHYAVALKYEQGKMDAPIVIARGMDRVAEKIKDEARRAGIPRIENRQLARALYAGSRVGDPIPIDFYNAVAEVLAHVYRIRNRRAR